MKSHNERCPLQVECERKCKFVNHEQDCDYYQGNARPGYEIEEITKAWEEDFDKTFLADLSDDDEEEFTTGKLVMIPVAMISPHPDNPRKDLGDLTELAGSIKSKGILQNLTVVPADNDGYTVIIGHRRLAASKIAGLTEVPCVIADMTPQEQFETMMVENVQRSDLTTYEQAEGFQTMLDMGGTVEEVSQKTGFSPTTVRNRVKLLQLNKKKFHEAEERGGTLRDYIKLSEIKDPERRNKVLESVGTLNFNNALKNAMEEQKFEEEFAQMLAFLMNADWCKEKTDENTNWDGDYKRHREFYRWDRKPITMPKDLDVASYIYEVGSMSVTIYRKGPEPEPKEKSPAEVRKERCGREMDKIGKKLKSISKTHMELREEFVQNFTAFNSSEMDIETFASKVLIKCFSQTSNPDLLGKLLNCPVTENRGIKTLDPEAFNTLLFNQPLRVLLCAAYSRLESVNYRYCIDSWNDKAGFSVPKYQTHNYLDLIYEGLTCLGYEMSEEEIQMQKGTHPLFKEAKDLLNEYLKEVKKK